MPETLPRRMKPTASSCWICNTPFASGGSKNALEGGLHLCSCPDVFVHRKCFSSWIRGSVTRAPERPPSSGVCAYCGALIDLTRPRSRSWASAIFGVLNAASRIRSKISHLSGDLAIGSIGFISLAALGTLTAYYFIGQTAFKLAYGGTLKEWAKSTIDLVNPILVLMATECSPNTAVFVPFILTFVTRPWRSDLLAMPPKPPAAVFIWAFGRAIMNTAWVYFVRKITKLNVRSRKDVLASSSGPHLALRLQHDDTHTTRSPVDNAMDETNSTGDGGGRGRIAMPQMLRQAQFKLGLDLVHRFLNTCRLDALAPYSRILLAPFIGRIIGDLLLKLAPGSKYLRTLFLKFPAASGTSPELWWKSTVGLTAWLIISDAIELLWIAAALQSRTTRVIQDRDFYGLDITELELKKTT